MQTWPDLISYNAALSTCSKGDQWQLAISLLSAMTLEKIEADHVSFNSVLSSFCEGLQWQRMFKMLEDMPEQHLAPDSIAYRAQFTDVCGACDNLLKAAG